MDKKNHFETLAFTYLFTKDNKLIIYRDNKEIKIIKGKNANEFLQLSRGGNQVEIQLKLAKLTGNYKRGNEKKED